MPKKLRKRNVLPRPSRHGPKMPPELIDIIIDYLHNDKKSLGTCSLVCKTWTRSARFHLFSELSVEGSDAKRKLESVRAIMPFVRHLDLDTQPWNETLPLFVGLKGIKSLSIFSLFFDPPPPLALFNYFPAMVDVRLDFVQFKSAGQLTQFICAFPCLQRIAIHRGGSCPYGFKGDSPAFNLSPHLRVLELDAIYMDAILNWYLALPRRPALRAVGLHATRWNNSETISKLLSALENSLEIFLITTIIIPGSEWPFDLRRNTCLRSLQIRLNHDSNDTMLVTQMLSQISSPHIEEVGLETSTGFRVKVSRQRWDEIDAALQHPLFSGLKTVTVRVVLLDKSDDWIPNAIKWVEDHMPLCHERGILRVCQRDWRYSYFLRR